MLPKTRAYVKNDDGQTKWMYFLIADDEVLENIILLGIKSALSIIKRFENQNKCLILNDSNHNCLPVISLYSVIKKDENYYPEVFLKECKYIEINIIRHINNNLSAFLF